MSTTSNAPKRRGLCLVLAPFCLVAIGLLLTFEFKLMKELPAALASLGFNETQTATAVETVAIDCPNNTAIETQPPVVIERVVTVVEKPTANKKKNLVAFAALGLQSAIATVHYNVMHHFSGNDWDCILFVYGDEKSINETREYRFKEIRKKCSTVRLPGLKWSQFLIQLTPTLTQHYQHIAIVLDDVFAPTRGDSPINVTSLLETLVEGGYSSISPSIKGAAWATTKPRGRCLYEVDFIETFFQIFTRPLFDCFISHLHYNNPHGFCIDLCLRNMCLAGNKGVGGNKKMKFAVDAKMTAYHLGMQYMIEKFIPPGAMEGANLTRTMRRPIADYEADFTLCEKYQCESNKTILKKEVGKSVHCG